MRCCTYQCVRVCVPVCESEGVVTCMVIRVIGVIRGYVHTHRHPMGGNLAFLSQHILGIALQVATVSGQHATQGIAGREHLARHLCASAMLVAMKLMCVVCVCVDVCDV